MPWNSNGHLPSEQKAQKHISLTDGSIVHSKQQMAQGSYICTEPNLIVCQIAFVTIYDSLKIKLNFISRSKSITHKILPEFVSVLKSDPTPSTGSGGPFRLSLQSLSH